MKRRWKFLAGAVALAVVAIEALNYEPTHPVVTIAPSGAVMLANVTIIDPTDGRHLPNMDVLTDKGRIVGIAIAGSAPTAAGTQRVDARGKFLVPGYNDYHAHPLGPEDPSGTLALMLVNGVTGFRQMTGSPRLLQDRRENRLPLGRYAPALLATPGTILTPFNAGTPEEAAATVRAEKAQGADFIKIGLSSPAAFFAAEDEAKRQGLPFAGHLQEGVNAAEASRRGMAAIEHLGPGDTVLVGCSTQEAAMRQEIAKKPPIKGPPFKFPGMERLFAGMLLKKIINPAADADIGDVSRHGRVAVTFDEAKCRTLAALFIANQTWHVPTLVRLRTSELAQSPEYAVDPNLRYMPPDVLESWREATARYAKNQSAAAKASFATAYALQERVAKLFDDAGVRMLAGSDESGAWEVPGFSLHQEFDLLAHAGLPPLHILQMATTNGADFFHRPQALGPIAAGRDADLVLLDADPTADIANMHRIAGVMRAGYYYDRRALDDILARVATGKGYFR